jgi:hypothetical protein
VTGEGDQGGGWGAHAPQGANPSPVDRGLAWVRERRAAMAARRAGRPEPSSARRHQAVIRGVLGGLLAFVLLLGADAALAARQLLGSVTAARGDLLTATEAVATGDPAAAKVGYREAAKAAERAVAATGRPGLSLVSRLPLVGDNVDASRAIAEAAGISAEAGGEMVKAARALRWKSILAPGIASLGQIDPDALAAALPHLTRTAKSLKGAAGVLEAADGRLFGPVASGYDQAVEQTARRLDLVVTARNLVQVLPALYGADGPQRYLLAYQSLGYPRGTGGLIDLVGTLEADAGVLTVADVAPASDPAAFSEVNVNPDVPTVATELLAAADAQDLGPFDGVVLVDAQALADLLWAVGDVETPAWPEPLRFSDAVTVLEEDTLLGTDPQAAQTTRAAIVRDVLTEALARRPSTEALATALARMVGSGHLSLWSADPRTQTQLRRLGATGAFEPGRNPLAILYQGTADNRAGAYARTRVQHNVTLSPEGRAKVRTVVTMTNTAPTDPRSILLGRTFGLAPAPVGSWSADLQVVLPVGAEGVGVETSRPAPTSVDDSGSQPIAIASLDTRSDEAMSTIVTYVRQAATVTREDATAYVVRISPQPSIAPVQLAIDIRLPIGTAVLSASEEFESGGTRVRYRGAPTEPLELWVRYG